MPMGCPVIRRKLLIVVIMSVLAGISHEAISINLIKQIEGYRVRRELAASSGEKEGVGSLKWRDEPIGENHIEN